MNIKTTSLEAAKMHFCQIRWKHYTSLLNQKHTRKPVTYHADLLLQFSIKSTMIGNQGKVALQYFMVF